MKHNAIEIFIKTILRKDINFVKKLIFILLTLIAFIWWLLFSSSCFYGDFNLNYTQEGHDGEYYLNMYQHLPTTPIAVYKLIVGDRYFWVLYNKQGKEIWHSPHYAYLSDTIGGLVIPTKKSNLLRYSSNEGWEAIDLTDKINQVNGKK
ncbi:DUF6201 family protein [Snodgrassella sp.]|uniref:DUF6201 family protein n=1 Tax=Snodgrassella sp. TaxID=2815304 RepID=UPI0025841332|nr:DUF6201 family protein [Snodgrassella sp.]MCO6518914.1 hypothetical protein [Snodgrassella sp.]